jgi:hypothetical protein
MSLTLRISGKCSDMFDAHLEKDGKRIADYDGYVLPCVGDGDYIELRIDVKTGQILNWEPMTEEAILAQMNEDGFPHVVLEHSEIVFGPSTLEECITWLDDYIAETAPKLKPGTDEYLQHRESYYSICREEDLGD